MKTIIAFSFASSLLASLACAQSQYRIDPSSVSNSTRGIWCNDQMTECPLICLQTAAMSDETEANSCDPDTLTYACVCSNGISPNISEYSQTLPYFVCTEWGNQCVSNCGPSDTACQSACRQDHPCGALNPTRVNLNSTSSSSMSSTTSGTSSGAITNAAKSTDGSGATIYSGYGGAVSTTAGGAEPGSAKATASGNGAANIRAAALNAGKTCGVMGVIAVLFGGFAVLL